MNITSMSSNHTTLTTKMCFGCELTKPVEEFYLKRRDGEVRQSRCKMCQNEQMREHYRCNASYYKEKARRRNKIVKRSNVQKLVEYLKQHPCIDCGESDTIVLQFDHRDHKNSNVGDLLRNGASWSTIEAEINLCDVSKLSYAQDG